MSVSSTTDAPHFIIDSEDRTSGSVESFDVSIQMKKSNSYNSVALIHCGIPKSYYNIDILNSEYVLKENGVDYVDNLPNGEYGHEASDITRIQNAFNTTSSDNNGASPWTYVLSFDTFTFKWTVVVTGHASRAVNLVNSGLVFDGHQTHDLLGFEDETTVLYGAGGIIIAPNVANFERTSYITIKSNICHNNGNDNSDSQILCRIPIKKTPFGELILYDLAQIEDGSKLIANNKSNTYSFSIYDDHDSLLFLNGRDWFFTLMCYEYNKLAKLEIEEIEMIRRQRKIAREKAIDAIDPNSDLALHHPPVEQIIVEEEEIPLANDIDPASISLPQ